MLLASLCLAPRPAQAISSAFTYQGHLKLNGSTVTDTCDLQFTLWGDPSGGSSIGYWEVGGINVAEGLFTTGVDFGQVPFDAGSERWVEIRVRCPAGTGSFETLSPRQKLTATPYSLYANQAGEVAWSAITGKPSGFFDDTDNDTMYSAGPCRQATDFR